MTGFLPDVNILIALIDADHVHFDRAHEWFSTIGDTEWLTCPITQNGAIRVVSGPKYVNGPVRVVEAMESIRTVTQRGRHVFVTDGISLLDGTLVNSERMVAAKHITDTYLLALATWHHATFVTFDKRVNTSAVVSEATSVLTLI